MSLNFYSFLPWARRGIASQIAEAESFGIAANLPVNPAVERADIQSYVHVTADGVAQTPVAVNLKIIGPGDVIGIHKDVVVRTEPRDWITNFEPHAFPFIEFYEEDFPWRYTPAKPEITNKKLRPWVTLVVLKEDEFERKTIDNAPLTAFQIKANILPVDWPLPKQEELWAWAHVSIDDKLNGGVNNDMALRIKDLNTKLNTNPDIAISRIICPRQLEENASYTAFLIPTFETGRRAGLGISTTGILAQAPAWNHIAPVTTPPASEYYGTFPIYHEWYFRTGATGDFEYLVRQVKPRVLDTRVGKRLMDIQDPGYGLTYTTGTPGTTAGTLMLEGALRVPNNGTVGYTQPYTNPSLKDFINLGEDMLSQGTPTNPWLTTAPFNALAGANNASDPVITAPLYGRWHAMKRKVGANNTNWLNELNLDPRNRLAASLGGDYVRNNQEVLMDKAWEQVGAVLEANKRARLAQLTLETTKALNNKHLASQPIEQLVSMTRNVQGKVKTLSGVSVRQQVLNGQLPEGADSNAFRKISRPTGVLMKRIEPTTANVFNNVLVTLSNDASKSPGAGKSAAANATTFQVANMNTAINAVIQYPNATAVNFNITTPNGPPMAANPNVAVNFQAVMGPYANIYAAANWTALPALPDVLAPTQFTVDIKDGIAPGTTFTTSFSASVGNNPLFSPPVPDAIVPAMTAPSFHISMYKSLQELGLDYFIPNLNLIPQNSITLLESNQKFIESFLVGANYEMGRELLWREYPTDQRGTYFKHFWNGSDSGLSESATRDITSIDGWSSVSALGSHNPRNPSTPNNLVLAIRGDFLKKFPTAVIYAVEADWQLNANGTVNTTINRVKKAGGQERYPIYSAKVDPDITFLGFDIDANTAKGTKPDGTAYSPPLPGYYFVIMERSGELRFGLDFVNGAAVPTLSDWNDLTWNNVAKSSVTKYLELTPAPLLTSLTGSLKLPPDYNTPPKTPTPPTPADTNWAEDSAAMAMIMYQNPVKVMIHAKEMLL
jgi:hypothetical protein